MLFSSVRICNCDRVVGVPDLFLESFYTATKSSQVEKNAQVISKSIEENKNALGTIENVASYNSLSVYVYDSTSLFTLKYCCEYDNPVSNLNFQYHDVYSYYKLAEENDGHYMFITSNYKEDSIKGKFERQFLMNILHPTQPRGILFGMLPLPIKMFKIWSTPTLSICRTAANAFDCNIVNHTAD